MSTIEEKNNKLINQLGPLLIKLERTRFPLNKESDTQTAIESTLKEMGIQFEREYVLSSNSRVDFYIPKYKLAIEVKIKGSRSEIQAQCNRYALHDKVAIVLLLSSRSTSFSSMHNNKPILVINMGKAWL